MKPARQFDLGYVRELDGLRAFAVMAVLLYHAGVPFLQGGFIGVDVFFVLSGFLITSLLLRGFDTRGVVSLRGFYFRRFLRLVPALLALVLALAVVAPVLLPRAQAKSYYVDALLALTYLSNWARAFVLHPPDLLAHTWSLAIEWQFYLLWPCLLVALLKAGVPRRRILTIAACLALLSWSWRSLLFATGQSIDRVYNGLDTRVDALMIGCALAVALSSPLGVALKSEQARRVLRLSAPAAVLVLLSFAVVGRWNSAAMVYYGFFVVAICAGVLVLAAQSPGSRWLRAVLSNRVAVWTGSISYGLYLWHYPVFRLIARSGLPHTSIVDLTAGMVITFGCAAASYYFLETPAMRLRNRSRRPRETVGAGVPAGRPD